MRTIGSHQVIMYDLFITINGLVGTFIVTQLDWANFEPEASASLSPERCKGGALAN